MSLRNTHRFTALQGGKWWYGWLLCQTTIVVCATMSSGMVFADSIEYRVKAAYLYQFTKFTEWPDKEFSDGKAPIRICVLGRNPFDKSLDEFSSKTSQNRTLVVEYLASFQEISRCHVVFISRSEEKYLSQILQLTEHSPVLTVSDMEGFARRGGIIGLVIERGKVRLEINPEASNHAGVKLSSKLLEVATLVQARRTKETP
ncbi:MAG: hypothetical protein BMS9Abin08_0603 [Gammaproteobacteria bacterium]|nr:MAG: hypothetical protein BMS9Abin08_0603 [Gammaproteobacteria bacterium]